MLNVAQAAEKASAEMAHLVGHPVAGILSCTRRDGGWRVVMEFLERKAVPDTSDLLATYLVLLDEDGELMNFQRYRVRRRGQPIEEELVEERG